MAEQKVVQLAVHWVDNLVALMAVEKADYSAVYLAVLMEHWKVGQWDLWKVV